jgi:hypothetical protein
MRARIAQDKAICCATLEVLCDCNHSGGVQMGWEMLVVRALPTARIGRIADYEPPTNTGSTEMKHTRIIQSTDLRRKQEQTYDTPQAVLIPYEEFEAYQACSSAVCVAFSCLSGG